MKISVGTRVKLRIPCLGNTIGTIGVCFADYGDEVYGFIFSNGEYDGFSQPDAEKFLLYLDEVPLDYTFTNVMQLSADFEKGVFDKVLI